MTTGKTMNTTISGVETEDRRGVHTSIGGESSIGFRQRMNRPLNEDNLRGIRSDAQILGSGEWVMA